MAEEECAGPSERPTRGQKRKQQNSSYCGLSEDDIRQILSVVDEDDIYLSEEDPFEDSGSEYSPDNLESESISSEVSSVDENYDTEQVTQNEEPEDLEAILQQSEQEIFWTSNEFVPRVHEFDRNNSGLKNDNLTPDSKEVDYFLSLFSEEIVNIVVTETNRYAAQQKAKNWKDINLPELYVFLAITMLMPRVKKLEMKEYWSQDNLLHTAIFRQKMSRDRYFQIRRYLHFCNNEEVPLNDRLYKIDQVMQKLRRNFQNNFYPFENLVIDESMVLFKGRLAFKQYIKTKRHRFGVKLYVLCDCETGSVLDFIIYAGKATNVQAEKNHDLRITGAIVAKLMSPFLNKGHSLFTDNFYTSPFLSNYLFQHKTNSCGTVRQNRKQMPVFEKKLKTGEVDWRSSNTMLALKWKDRRDVIMLTTIHANKIVSLPKISRITKENIKKPLCVVEYNTHMGAVDRSDMMISSIDCTRKSIKWYAKVFFHSVDVTLLNSHAMFSTQHPEKVPFAKFHLEVIRQYSSTEAKPLHFDQGNARLTERHFPELVPRKEGKKSATRRCKVCSQTKAGIKKRKESSYMCRECDVGLCVVPCFRIYHQVADF
ncbi:unnamed protein product [Acanthoscelides obtectus]|uniref:PiggyBac transposable element-derived protein 4 n=2 Tax=Acanthoscelides obtectus TaxID=200917 RepID=A0A9P0M4F7_ACAOB|nr:unnamed protein product [Acanthoscelides obtectus]CAK1643245.1 PiggyBac transposable element-derived protein 4 [Acanthoscelides obtectus]